jgi:hypothetical protein
MSAPDPPKKLSRRSLAYRSLDAARIIDTAVALRGRIQERFPRAGLCKIAGEVEVVALESAERASKCAQPQWQIRSVAIALTVMGVAGVLMLVTHLQFNFSHEGVSQLLQDIYNILNDMILFGVGLVFLWSWEGRIKRGRALRALHELRSLAHIVDMHQFTKDPENLAKLKPEDAVQPKGPVNLEELIRYLVFCTDLLGLFGKISALYAQELQDGIVLASVTEIEELSTALSQKIWQKIAIIERKEGAKG